MLTGYNPVRPLKQEDTVVAVMSIGQFHRLCFERACLQLVQNDKYRSETLAAEIQEEMLAAARRTGIIVESF